MKLLLLFLLSTLVAGAQPAQIGVHIGHDTDPARALPRLRELGVTWVRLWVDVDWDSEKPPRAFATARIFHAAGLKVLVAFNAHVAEAAALKAGRTLHEYHRPERVASWFTWALAQTGVSESIDLWEIGNEVHVDKYWRGTLGEFVEWVQAPAYGVLHSQGELVVGVALTPWQRNLDGESGYLAAQTAELVRTTRYLETCDYAGIHPYTQNVAQLREHLDAVVPLFKGKPIIASEWNLKRPTTDHAEWARQLDAAGALVHAVSTLSIHYRLLGTNREGGWPGLCLDDSAYTPREPYFSVVRSWTAK